MSFWKKLLSGAALGLPIGPSFGRDRRPAAPALPQVSPEAQAFFGTQSGADQAAIQASLGSGNNIESWYRNAKAAGSVPAPAPSPAPAAAAPFDYEAAKAQFGAGRAREMEQTGAGPAPAPAPAPAPGPVDVPGLVDRRRGPLMASPRGTVRDQYMLS